MTHDIKEKQSPIQASSIRNIHCVQKKHVFFHISLENVSICTKFLENV